MISQQYDIDKIIVQHDQLALLEVTKSVLADDSDRVKTGFALVKIYLESYESSKTESDAYGIYCGLKCLAGSTYVPEVVKNEAKAEAAKIEITMISKHAKAGDYSLLISMAKDKNVCKENQVLASENIESAAQIAATKYAKKNDVEKLKSMASNSELAVKKIATEALEHLEMVGKHNGFTASLKKGSAPTTLAKQKL